MALLESEALVDNLMNLDLYDWLEVPNVDDVPGDTDTDVSEDDSEDSTLRDSTDDADREDIRNLFDITETDPDSDPDENKDSLTVVADTGKGIAEVGMLSRHCGAMGAPSDVVNDTVSRTLLQFPDQNMANNDPSGCRSHSSGCGLTQGGVFTTWWVPTTCKQSC